MKTYLITAVLVLLSFNVNAGTLPKDSLVCTSNDYLDEMSNAIYAKDETAINFLVSSGKCLLTKADFKASQIDNGFTYKKLRVYAEGQGIVVYTRADLR